MPTSLLLPEKCGTKKIVADTDAARAEFRKRRLDEQLNDYQLRFPTAKAAADVVVGALSRVLAIPADKNLIADFVGNKERYAALRSLAATPISADDLRTLLHSSVNKTILRKNQALADNLVNLIRTCLDPHRFPWVASSRPPTNAELAAAQLATAVLTAVSAVQAGRRSDERSALEGSVTRLLTDAQFVHVKRPKSGVQTLAQFPNPGEYMIGCRFGQHTADFVVRLRDGRVLAMECKASNSEVNGFKRLNKEVVVDAGDWYRKFGQSNIVVAAVLRGVFKPSNVADAQTQGVFLFWWHRMNALAKFLRDT